jgi:hypothetical protein
LHQSHEFDKEEFDKGIVSPRPEFPNRAAGWRSNVWSWAAFGSKAVHRARTKLIDKSLPPGAPRHFALEACRSPA